ncbi:MAG: cysteine desulfurase-like protein [Candidatus Eremiobacter antarcticus]|nr:MAG: cysteine desulfurase-like protein [Candidatus Eremiobacter sp. RRmetagenome_bin22]
MKEFPVDSIRAQFPSLGVTDGERTRTYLDNPAGTQVPQRVSDAIARFFKTSNANLGGYFSTSIAAGDVMFSALRALAVFVGASSEREIVVGPSMTSLTYTFSRSLGRMFGRGDELIVTRMDHDGNISPWLAMAQERGAVVRWLPFDQDTWRIEPEALDAVLSDRTRLLALNYASNLTGSINDVRALSAKARQAGALVYVDAVQYAPHRLIDAPSLGCDFLTCSAYKFYGPHLGVLWGREDVLHELYAYKVRPLTDTLPERFEVGTPQLELLAAATATIEHFEWIGNLFGSGADRRARIAMAFDALCAWESELARRLIDGLTALPGVTIRGISDAAQLHLRVPTVSFTHSSCPSAEIARRLAGLGIFVWSGHNYALEIARSLALDEEDGVVRIGLAQYNTPQEIDKTISALSALLAPHSEHHAVSARQAEGSLSTN